jgi:lipopolysaccharide transport system permease protein
MAAPGPSRAPRLPGNNKGSNVLELFRALWRYRYFIASSVRNEFRARVARSQLGAAWMVLQPLAQVAIFALVLSEVLAARLPGTTNTHAYAIYLMAGSLAWSLFNEITGRCLNVFVENAGLLKKIVFPRICLPIVVVGSALVNSLLLFLAMVLIFALMGHMPGLELLWLLPVLALTVAFALGLGLLLGVLNVFLRDVGQVMAIVLQLWFWLTPIVYMPSIVPAAYRPMFELNPLYPIVRASQQIILYQRAPDGAGLLWVAGLSVLLLGAALLLFRRASPDMVDVL